MSDGTRLNQGLGGDLICTEQTTRATGKIPVSKIVLGDVDVDGGDVSATNPMPVQTTAASAIRLTVTGGASLGTVKGSAGKLWGWQVYNPNSTIVYLQVFDATSPTPGTSTPVLSLFVPILGGIDAYLDSPISFSNAIKVTVTTTPTGGTAPASAAITNFLYS
jgi:hypothetical protein